MLKKTAGSPACMRYADRHAAYTTPCSHLQLSQIVLILPLKEIHFLQQLFLVELELAHGCCCDCSRLALEDFTSLGPY